MTAGTLLLSGTDTYTGSTNVNGGTLIFAGNETGIGSALNVQNGTLQLATGSSIASTSVVTLGSSSGNGTLHPG